MCDDDREWLIASAEQQQDDDEFNQAALDLLESYSNPSTYTSSNIPGKD